MADRKNSKAYDGKKYTCNNDSGKDSIKKAAKGGKNGGDVGKSPFSTAGGGSADKNPYWK